MPYLKSISLGAVAGLIGAAIWAVIAFLTGYEVGWIAWGVGALVGVAVRFASAPEVSYTGDSGEDAVREMRAESDQLGPGVIAAVIAILSVVVGKLIAVSLFIGNLSAADLGEELLISYVADEVVFEETSAGRSVSWPAGVDPEYAAAEEDYPADVWAEARRRWQGFNQEEQDRFADQATASLNAALLQNVPAAVLGSFAMMDLLWFGLAAWTAFKIGASGSEE